LVIDYTKHDDDLICRSSLLQGSNKYQFYSLWFDPTGALTHDLPHANHYVTDAVNIILIWSVNLVVKKAIKKEQRLVGSELE
jgi:hypothetical protein